VEYAKEIGMVDEVFAYDSYYEELHQFAKSKFDDDFIWDKQDFLEENREKIEAFKEAEIEIMYPEFWEEDSIFHELRREFVWKICPVETPKRLKLFG
jgi:putative two-component system hydrogenase maturation factor HypX/HoxX